MHSAPLPVSFYLRDVTQVARDLLGKRLIHNSPGGILTGMITETEAYDGHDDPASHSYPGPKPRNTMMFKEGGILYVYRSYGIHFCANAVTGAEGYGAAVLIRSVEPESGKNVMAANRFGAAGVGKKDAAVISNGPGKVCQAFGIDMSHNGVSLQNGAVNICDSDPVEDAAVGMSERIGITKATDRMWRFYIKGNRYVPKQ